MKKSLLCLWALLFTSIISYSQALTGTSLYTGGSNINTEKYIKEFANRTLLVVVDDTASPRYSKAIRDAFSNYWKATKFIVIQSSDLQQYMESNQYFLFSFMVDDLLSEPVTASYIAPNGSIKYEENRILGANDIPANVTNPKYSGESQVHKMDKIVAWEHYYFQFSLCGSYGALQKHSFSNLQIADFQEIRIKDADESQPVKYMRDTVISSIIPMVIRFNAQVAGLLTGNRIKEEDVRIDIMTLYRGQKKPSKSKFIVNNINDGLQEMAGKKIYIDSLLVRPSAIRLLAHVLNTDPSNIIIVNRERIKDAFVNKEPVYVLGYCSMVDYIPTKFSMYRIDGTQLATFDANVIQNTATGTFSAY